MFRNSGKNPFYQIKYKTANDYFTFFSLLCEGKRFVNLPEKLLYYRIDGKNASLKNIKKGLLANIRIKYDIALSINIRCHRMQFSKILPCL